MKVSCLKVGYLECNCYLLEENSRCLLIDPGDELNRIKEFIGGKNIVGILVTHHHFDHVGCLLELKKELGVEVYDFSNLKEGINEIFGFEFEVIYTPGHKEDCVSYYFYKDKVMFTGDFLFLGTVGRCDLDGGDFSLMLDSISKIKGYDDDILVYPGHGNNTVLGVEKRGNPYFRG